MALRLAIVICVVALTSFGAFLLLHSDGTMVQQTAWSVHLGTGFNDGASGTALDKQGNLYLVGTTKGRLGSTSAGDADYFAAKYDSRGNLIWSVQHGTVGYSSANNCTIGGDGNLYVVGCTEDDSYGSNNGKADAFVAKISPAGSLIWGRQVGSSADDLAQGVAVDENGNVYIVGTTYGLLFGTTFWEYSSDCFLAKYDSNGNLVWGKQIGNSHDDEGADICVSGEDRLYITGSTITLFDPNAQTTDAFLAKLDLDGNILWGRQFGGNLYDGAECVCADSSGNAYVGGDMNMDDDPRKWRAATPDAFIAKYNGTGDQLWMSQLSTAGEEGVMDIAADSAGNVAASGATTGGLFGTNVGSDDVFAVEYSPTGTALRDYQSGSTSSDFGTGIAVGSDGSLHIVGSTEGALYGANLGGEDAFVAKIGAAVPTFIPAAGTYTGKQKVTITCPTKGAVIRYTTDGSDPTEKSPRYTRPITIDHTLTLKARAWKKDHFPSSIQSAEYKIASAPGGR